LPSSDNPNLIGDVHPTSPTSTPPPPPPLTTLPHSPLPPLFPASLSLPTLSPPRSPSLHILYLIFSTRALFQPQPPPPLPSRHFHTLFMPPHPVPILLPPQLLLPLPFPLHHYSTSFKAPPHRFSVPIACSIPYSGSNYSHILSGRRTV